MKRSLYRTGRWFRRQKWGKIFLILLIIAAWVGIMFVFISPSMLKLRNSMLFRFLLIAAFTLPVGWYVWVRKRESSLIERMVATIPLIWLWGGGLIPSGQVRILLWTVIFYGMIGYFVYLFHLSHTTYESQLMELIGIEAVWMGIIYSINALKYSLVTTSFPLVLWLPALIMSFICAVVILILLMKGWLVLPLVKGRSLSPRVRLFDQICVGITLPCIVFIFFVFSAMNLNYALDFGAPVSYTACVVDKEYSYSSRGGSSFDLILELNGERIELSVSESDYCSHEIGDDFAVELHQGAFGVPFYIEGK